MNFQEHTASLRNELETYYSTFDPEAEPLCSELKELLAAYPSDSSLARKSRMHTFLAGRCKVKIFRHTPLFFEISSGRGRYSWGGLSSRVGSFLHQSTASLWLDPYGKELQKDREEGYFHGWNNPVGFDHHCAGYSNLLKYGLRGIIEQAEEKLSHCTDVHQAEFYKSVIQSNQALILLAKRFADNARSLAQNASDTAEKQHYSRIAETASYIPEHPARTFCEALNTILFYRECVGSLEGIGISTFGLLDRMLYPYYRSDLECGRITEQEARQLIADLLIYTDIRFNAANSYNETSTTIELGGTDTDGSVVFNELTEMILQTALDVHAVSTKINCRISRKHPLKYLEKIMDVQLSPLPCVMMHNDDVLIPARVKRGQKEEDARWYVGCGCHEIVLANTEVCTRADSWISLPRILLASMEKHADASSFDVFYSGFMDDVRSYYNRIVSLKNEGEKHWCEYDPLPLYSSSLTGPLEKGKDVTEGGAVYNTTALSLLGAATVIDSLYSIKHLIFDQRKMDIPALIQLSSGWFQRK